MIGLAHVPMAVARDVALFEEALGEPLTLLTVVARVVPTAPVPVERSTRVWVVVLPCGMIMVGSRFDFYYFVLGLRKSPWTPT